MVANDNELKLKSGITFRFYMHEGHKVVDPVDFESVSRLKAGIIADFKIKEGALSEITGEDYEKIGRFVMETFIDQMTSSLD